MSRNAKGDTSKLESRSLNTRAASVPMFFCGSGGHSDSGLLLMWSGIILLAFRKGHIENILLAIRMFLKYIHNDSDRDDDDTNSSVTCVDFVIDRK